MKNISNNLAFIDGQNLYMGTKKIQNSWDIDLKKFRVFLKDKYNVVLAYYFLGFMDYNNKNLYKNIVESNFVLVFRKHNINMLGKKKGNVDSDIIFNIMEKMYKHEIKDKLILISGDGDYKELVDFLISENKLEKILFPNKEFSSSLYNELGSEFFDFLDSPDIKRKIEIKKELLRH